MANQPDREALRNSLLKARELKRVPVTIAGQKLELVQMTLRDLVDSSDTDDVEGVEVDTATQIARQIVRSACIPGTTTRVFNVEDAELIAQWPYNEELTDVQQAIAGLMGVGDAAETLKGNPTDEQ